MFTRSNRASGTHFYQWQGWTSVIITMLAQGNNLFSFSNTVTCTCSLPCSYMLGILQLRIYALYTKNRKILTLILCLYLCSFSASAGLMGVGLTKLDGMPIKRLLSWDDVHVLSVPLTSTLSLGMSVSIPAQGQFCLFTVSTTTTNYAFWIPPLAFDSFLSMLAMLKAFTLRKFLGSNSISRHSGAQLIDIFYHDSVIYFIAWVHTYISPYIRKTSVWLVLESASRIWRACLFGYLVV